MFCKEADDIIAGRHPADWSPKDIRAIVRANVTALENLAAEAATKKAMKQ